MRYQKSPLDVRRAYVKIQKLILKSLFMAESRFCVKINVFEDKESNFEV